MLELEEDFVNKVIEKIREVYFPTVNVLAGDKEWNSNKVYQKYSKAKYQIELLSNGCMHYAKFIEKLAKLCNDTNQNTHKLIENYVVSFGGYKYKANVKYKSTSELDEIIEEISFKTFYDEQLEMFRDIYGFIYTQCDNGKNEGYAEGMTTFQIQVEDGGNYIGEFIGNDNDGYIFKNYNEK